MITPPSGTVTFLFTEIEDSAKLSQDNPDIIQIQLINCFEIIQKAVKANDGFLFKKSGEEACCCAFEKASDAVKAAVSAQLYFRSEKNNTANIKVRMGIHTGVAEWEGKDYNGYLTLATVQRIMSSAYGEQILISASSVSKAAEQNPDIAEFRDLGMRKMKDIKNPVKLFQIVSKGLRQDFPPIKTIDERLNNLPVQVSSFIGREKELTEIKKLLTKSKLLTLTGPGGTGKTRLSIQTGYEVADEFENGVFIAELASVNDPPQILNVIADALNLKASGGADIASVITDFLKEKQLLLILDNCEHLVSECAKISNTLLHSCQDLKIIVSSRELLKITGETSFHVPALTLPEK
ncbi:MAG TPA: adenylate/guanylate cyclase domain-containing protein, partial [Ignavibacteria bacterium]|nr:adenylate/guanylate cyclase domain-containing protein [Ignavibacteria bacterium]